MKWKNVSEDHCRIAQLGVDLAPGDETEIADRWSLRSRNVAFGREWLPSTVDSLSGGKLAPATDADQERYDTVALEDTAEQRALHESWAAKQARRRAEANPPKTASNVLATIPDEV